MSASIDHGPSAAGKMQPSLLEQCLSQAEEGFDGRKSLSVSPALLAYFIAADLAKALSAALNDEETRRKLVECARGDASACGMAPSPTGG